MTEPMTHVSKITNNRFRSNIPQPYISYIHPYTPPAPKPIPHTPSLSITTSLAIVPPFHPSPTLNPPPKHPHQLPNRQLPPPHRSQRLNRRDLLHTSRPDRATPKRVLLTAWRLCDGAVERAADRGRGSGALGVGWDGKGGLMVRVEIGMRSL